MRGAGASAAADADSASASARAPVSPPSRRLYTGPAEVLHGTADDVVPVAYGQRYGDLLPGATFTPVEGADHGWSAVPLRQLIIGRLVAFVGSASD